MYTSLDCTPLEARPGAGDDAGRRKLWQLDPVCRGSLIDACLSPRELGTQRRKLQIAAHSLEAGEFRRVLVEVSGEPSPAARRLHKYLDRKHWRTILRFTAATSAAALGALWHEADAGETAGAYWALATHPHVTAGLLGQAHREVRSRVRSGGHAIRLDERTLSRLRRTRDAFAGQHNGGGTGAAMRESAAGQYPQTMPADPDPARLHPALQQMESRLLSLRTQVEEYAAKLALERVRAERAEASAREWRELAIRYEARHRRRDATTGATVRRMTPPRRQSGANAAIHGTG